MMRSMAPPPPTPWFQLMNLAPVTERMPRGVCHLALSSESGWAPQARSTSGKGMARSWSTLWRIDARFIVVTEDGAQALALFHVEDVTGLGQSVDEGGGEVVV